MAIRRVFLKEVPASSLEKSGRYGGETSELVAGDSLQTAWRASLWKMGSRSQRGTPKPGSHCPVLFIIRFVSRCFALVLDREQVGPLGFRDSLGGSNL